MKLYKHQQDIVDKNPPRAGLWWQTGTGKSLALLKLAEKNAKSALLICPKSIKYKWKDEVKDSPVKFTVMTKEEFRRDHKQVSYNEAFIIDEAHHFSNPKSQLHKAAKAWLKKNRPKAVWLATATCYRSTPWNVFALYALLGRPLNYIQFQQEFFKPQYMGHRIIYVPDESKNDKLQEMLRAIGSLITLEDCIDMPEAVFEYETVPLTREQERMIENLEEENPIVRYVKIHQIENSTLKGNEFEDDITLKNNKTERILEIADTTPKLAVFAKYNLQVKSIASELAKEGYTVFTLTGQTKNEEEVISQANEAERCVIVINAEKAEGYELPSFQHVVYASLPWSLVSYTQSQGRFRRINNPQRVSYTILTADGEVDKAVKKSLDRKLDFQIELYLQEKNRL